MAVRPLFEAPFLAGFECSAHRRPDGRRLDLIAATGHDDCALEDYLQVASHGMRTVRDGLRWHLIETTPGRYDWGSFLPMLRASRTAGVRVIWDLCHYGWPDDLDIWSPSFVDRFARFAEAAARLIASEQDEPAAFCPVNEISFWAWAGGDMARMNPCATGRGGELKRQLVRAAMAGIEAVRSVDPRSRIVHAEPAIHVAAGRPEDAGPAEAYRRAQWEVWDMLSGRVHPELGGRPDYLDVLGMNFYSDNQWYLGGGTIPLGHHAYRPFSELLQEVFDRYGRPLLIAETGAEGSAGPAWLHYVGQECRRAIRAGVPVEGICLYPVVDYPGWENERVCHVGLLGAQPAAGGRAVDPLLAEEIARQTGLFLAEAPPRLRATG